jgi:hypothetical protein
MHWQSRVQAHEKAHRLSLMPLAPPEGELPLWAGVTVLVLVFLIGTVMALII